MRLNTRGRYGMQLLTQLACHIKDPRPIGLKQVAAATGLPWRYLEQIAGPLRKAALIKGRPGRTGGYNLGRLPERISRSRGAPTVSSERSSSLTCCICS